MRQFLINDLQPSESEKIQKYLQKKAVAADISGLYWLELPENLVAEKQQGHEQCGPFSFAIEAGEDFVSFELLVRSKANLHCSCTSYATRKQAEFLFDFADNMLISEGISA